MSQIAKECKLTNPKKQKAASLRSEHICTLVNAEDTIDAKTIMASSRHKSEAAHNVYKRKSHIQLDKKTKAFHAEKRKYQVSILIKFILIHINKSHNLPFANRHLAAAAIHHHQLTRQIESLQHKTSSVNMHFHHHHRYQTNTFLYRLLL